MSNKIIKQNPVIQEKEVHWKAKCLYMLAGIAVAYGLAFLMLGKNDGVIFMQWHIYMMLMLELGFRFFCCGVWQNTRHHNPWFYHVGYRYPFGCSVFKDKCVTCDCFICNYQFNNRI